MAGIEVRDIRRGKFFWIDNEIIDDYGSMIGSYGIAIYCVLARHANQDTQQAWPSLERIASLSGCSKRTVQRTIKTLEDVGLVSKDAVYTEAGDIQHMRYCLLDVKQSTTVYDVWSESPHVWTESPQGVVRESTEQDLLNKTWVDVLSELSSQMTRQTFTQWLAGSRLEQLNGGSATVRVRDAYAVDWCANRLRAPIERTLAGIAGLDAIAIEFVTSEVK